jgi:hypothetical protein
MYDEDENDTGIANSESVNEVETAADGYIAMSLDWMTRRTAINHAVAWGSLSVVPDPAFAVRAVGSGEADCREKGNCWEKGEWDGARSIVRAQW